MRTVHIYPHEITVKEGWFYSAATIESSGSKHDIYFAAPEDARTPAPSSHGHFLLASLFFCMGHAERVVLHGVAHPSLLASLEELSVIWNVWRPEKYHSIGFEAESVPQSSAEKNGYVFTFSGGADACATLWRHTHGGLGNRRRPVRRAIQVHGFDIPFDDPTGFDIAFSRAKEITGSIDIDLVPIRTNVRTLERAGLEWEDAFGAIVASTLHFAGADCIGGVFASGQTYRSPLFPWGSNPLTDPLLGCVDFPVITDGAECGRLEKVRIVSQWPEALNAVRVCWAGKESGRNCGVCEKCRRTMLELLICGSTDLGAFEMPLAKGAIASIRIKDVVRLRFYEEALRNTRPEKRNEWWAQELAQLVKRGIEKPPLMRRIRSTVRLRTRLRQMLGDKALTAPADGGA